MRINRKISRIDTLGNFLKRNLPYTGLPVLVGIISAVLLTITFARLAGEIIDKSVVNPDYQAALWVHSFSSPSLTVIFDFLTNLGGVSIEIILTGIILAGLFLRKLYQYAVYLVLATGGGALINGILKLIFQRPRPDLWPGIHQASGYSFPSGHAMSSACFYGFLIWLGFKLIRRHLLKILLAGALLLIILIVGLSRVYLGVHYPSDVLGGYLASSSWLVVLLTGSHISTSYFNTRRKSRIGEAYQSRKNR